VGVRTDARTDRRSRHDLGLTVRESGVAAFLAKGLTNRDIGAALWLSENTIKSHLKAIYRKVHLASRGETIAHFVSDPGFRRKAVEHQSRTA
jgi:DNA-binding NarL/FixJ family response regulator